ncbi:hypothetical protein ZIOFF_018592 [Zingiber officinale]|uniref:Uncharacterized protein n=1 Tax=Zingiber officinale TaxID=94328 RepID=A0A8J5HD28_ZINOF|nr:hypothetical protein ZIOFF_018592 [Zingiber officinale]
MVERGRTDSIDDDIRKDIGHVGIMSDDNSNSEGICSNEVGVGQSAATSGTAEHSCRPRWTHIDKACMNNTCRSSQSSYNRFCTDDIYLHPRAIELPQKEAWINVLIEGVSELAVNILSINHLESIEINGEETFENASIRTFEINGDVIFFGTLWVFHFLMSSLKSERSSYMLDIILKLLYTVISLQILLNRIMLARRPLSKMLKRWPSLVSKLVLTPTAKLQDSKDPKHLVLGCCSVLSTETVSRHLAYLNLTYTAYLCSSHHESLKAQKAIIEV